jgi:hypothetical protein
MAVLAAECKCEVYRCATRNDPEVGQRKSHAVLLSTRQTC